MVELMRIEGLQRDAGVGTLGEQRVMKGSWASETLNSLSLVLRTARRDRCRGTDSGSRDGWTFNPPYLAELKMRRGTKRPNDTAMMRLISEGVFQSRKVSSS